MQNVQSSQQFSKFKSHLKEQFGTAVYDSYFDRLSLADAGDDYVTLAAPTRFSASLISQRYARRMKQMWSETVCPVSTLNVCGAQELAFETAVPSRLAVGSGGSAVPTAAVADASPVQTEEVEEYRADVKGEDRTLARAVRAEDAENVTERTERGLDGLGDGLGRVLGERPLQFSLGDEFVGLGHVEAREHELPVEGRLLAGREGTVDEVGGP